LLQNMFWNSPPHEVEYHYGSQKGLELNKREEFCIEPCWNRHISPFMECVELIFVLKHSIMSKSLNFKVNTVVC